MPRVIKKRANRGATKAKMCGATYCRVDEAEGGRYIQAGQTYYTWSFRYGGTYYQHERCGFPRPSQLTQSKVSAIYAAVEAAEDELARLTWEDAGKDAQEILGPVAETAREVAQEYRDAAESMGSAGEEMEAKADNIESWADELESVTVDDWEEPDPGDKDAPSLEDAAAEWVENFRSTIQEAMSNLPE
jgi:cell division septum initiation protein DivIVA